MVIQKKCSKCNKKLNLREKRSFGSVCQVCVDKHREQDEWEKLWKKDVQFG
jgi:hypothetical protein